MKWLIVAVHEYQKQVRRRAFLVATLGIPLFIVAIGALSVFVATTGDGDSRPIGYIDEAAVLPGAAAAQQAQATPASQDVELRAFADRSVAEAALAAGHIQAYYVLPADYLRTGRVELIYWDSSPDAAARRSFERFLKEQLLAAYSEELRARVSAGAQVSLHSAADGAEVGETAIFDFLLAFVIGALFVFVVMGSADFLLQALTTEKENRMVEVLFTSVSPLQLIGGKAAGLIVVALTQVAIWLLALGLAWTIAARFFEVLQAVRVSWSFVLLVVLYFLPAYVLIAGIMTTLSSVLNELQQAQQIAGMLNLLFVLPFFFVAFIFTDPDSSILVALTLFPTTSFLTVAMRWSVTDIPAWQLLASWSLLLVSALGSVWVAARVFRLGLLHYGQPLNFRQIVHLVRVGGQ